MLWRGHTDLSLRQYGTFDVFSDRNHTVAWTHRSVVKTVRYISGLLWGRIMLRREHTDLLLRYNAGRAHYEGDSYLGVDAQTYCSCSKTHFRSSFKLTCRVTCFASDPCIEYSTLCGNHSVTV